MGSWFSQEKASSTDLTAVQQQCEAVRKLTTDISNVIVNVNIEVNCEQSRPEAVTHSNCNSDEDLAATLQYEDDFTLACELQCVDPPDGSTDSGSDTELATELQSQVDQQLAFMLQQMDLIGHIPLSNESHEEEERLEDTVHLSGREMVAPNQESEEYAEYSLTTEEPQWEGLNAELINQLPKSLFSGHGNNRSCGICHSEYRLDDILRTLPCCHLFHCSCVDDWLKRNGTCPVCRKDVKGELLTL